MAVDVPKDKIDDLARVVIDRYQRAKNYRHSHILHQGRTIEHLMLRANSQYQREYTGQDSAMMAESFGFVPSRYYGIVQQKVNATLNWKLDLVVTSLDAMFTIEPTPEPDIDPASRERIRKQVHSQLLQRMAEVGIADPELLMTSDGNINPEIVDYLEAQADALKVIEQARIVSAASKASDKARLRLRDIIVEGGFRQAYMGFTFDQILHGRGVMRVPHWKTKAQRYYTRSGQIKRRWARVPAFTHIDVLDFYPLPDADNLLENTGNTERTSVTKAELINMARLKESGYDKSAIEDLLENFAYRPRNWLDTDRASDDADWWGLDEAIPLLIHEGFFSGKELADIGITGVDILDYVSARVEVVGGTTIRCELIESDGNPGRTYFQAPNIRKGDGVYDAIGFGAQLWDTEQRVNRLLHLFEHNIDWASRPPIMRNKNAFDNPHDAAQITPGAQYDVEEAFGVTGSMPDPIRPMSTVSAQYHLIMTQVGQLLRQADEDVGVPAFAYSSQDFGRSSLGEYSQRMSNALRQIKGLALMEDIFFIEPAFTNLYDLETEEDSDLRKGSDVNIVIRGITGLLSEDMKEKRQNEILPFVIQGAQTGIFPPQAMDYAVRQLLESAGFPVDSLGLRDPITDLALAEAASEPLSGINPLGQQVPQIDGRSGPVNPQAVSSADGLSNFNLQQTAPIE